MDVIIFVLIIFLGGMFFLTLFRAAQFARRHKDQLTGIVAKSSWWMRLFAKNGYGQAAEPERKRLAMQWLIVMVLFFLVAGSAQLIYVPK